MIRQNPVTKSWVIMAPERGKRPAGGEPVIPRESQDRRGDCPFCKGPEGEDRKPSLILTDDRGWYLYVIPNRYPALSPETTPDRTRDGARLSVGGFGLAEIVVESNDHWGYLYKRPIHEARDLFATFQSRVAALLKDPRVQQVIVFQNCGPRAGASQPHPHSQIYALPIVPANIRREIESRRLFYDNEGACPECQFLDLELHQNQRIIAKNDLVVAFCPWASEVPYEVHLVPRRHVTCLTLMEPKLLEALADATRAMLCRIINLLGIIDYNLVIDTAPRDDRDAPFFHLRVRILPRLATPAGFEIATGIPVNTVLPETAAKELAGQSLADLTPY
ncbi:MAG: DUF4921 family protein [Candidatus Riflebacteria bacterium]|nr:DUF4921 family protein [Candidatus Riflebacteria bacterium]